MHFVDTNIVVYAYGSDMRTERAAEVLNAATISVQVLNEFANVAVRKLGYAAGRLDAVITSIRSQVGAIVSVDEATHDLAREIHARYKLAFYDCVLVAAAMLAKCDTLYSEDMHHGLTIEDILTIRNPFA